MKTTINCLLIDDEPLALEVLRGYTQSMPMLEIIGECSNAISALQVLRERKVDLMFLDINMPQISGLEFLRALPEHPKVIVTSAHKDFAVDGFEIGIVDYLLKPFSFDRFMRAVSRAFSSDKNYVIEDRVSQTTPRFIYVKADRKMRKVMLDEVLYIESLKDYARIFINREQVITKQKISALEEMLPESSFARIHRSFIVNISKVNSLSNTSVFIDKIELPIGPLFKNSALKRLKFR